ncbi:MAG TPA: preprotein translocase subunit YajC [Alphaproteobacteria bacterium]|nr:preprotein translocase subunit YajC [Alphaproteobacteria bacterium]HAJ47088.1 preprotein translocase subunit YajC [Alphaproteobacteria bacterium]
MFVTQAYAQAAGGGGGMDAILIQLVPLLLIFAIMYFLVMRPQQQRIKAHQMMVANLKRGDQVVTSGGVLGKIVKVEDAEVTLDVGEGVKMRVVRHMIQEVRSKSEPAQ